MKVEVVVNFVRSADLRRACFALPSIKQNLPRWTHHRQFLQPLQGLGQTSNIFDSSWSVIACGLDTTESFKVRCSERTFLSVRSCWAFSREFRVHIRSFFVISPCLFSPLINFHVSFQTCLREKPRQCCLISSTASPCKNLHRSVDIFWATSVPIVKLLAIRSTSSKSEEPSIANISLPEMRLGSGNEKAVGGKKSYYHLILVRVFKGGRIEIVRSDG